MKINVKYDEFGNIVSLETIGKEVDDFSEAEQHQYDTFIQNCKELAELREKNFHEEKMKAFEENRIIQVEIAKNQAEMSMTSSQTYGKFWDALGSLAIASCCPDQPRPNQLPQNPNSQPTKK